MTRAVALLVPLLLAGCLGDSERIEPGTPDAAPPDPPDPGILATGPVDAYEVVHDADTIYWVTVGQSLPSARLMKVSKAGGPAVTLLEKAPRLYGLAIDGEYVYTSNYADAQDGNGSILRVPKGGGPVETVVDSLWVPFAIDVDDEYVYWSSAVSPDGAVFRALKTGGLAQRIADPVDGPWDLAVDATHVYYTEMNLGRVMRVLKDGSALPEELASGWIGTVEIAIGPEDVYFAACATGECDPVSLYSVPKIGGALVTLGTMSSGGGGGGKISVAGDTVFFAQTGAGRVVAMPITGGEVTALIEDQPGPMGVSGELGGAMVYWVDFFSGVVGALEVPGP